MTNKENIETKVETGNRELPVSTRIDLEEKHRDEYTLHVGNKIEFTV